MGDQPLVQLAGEHLDAVHPSVVPEEVAGHACLAVAPHQLLVIEIVPLLVDARVFCGDWPRPPGAMGAGLGDSHGGDISNGVHLDLQMWSGSGQHWRHIRQCQGARCGRPHSAASREHGSRGEYCMGYALALVCGGSQSDASFCCRLTLSRDLPGFPGAHRSQLPPPQHSGPGLTAAGCRSMARAAEGPCEALSPRMMH